MIECSIDAGHTNDTAYRLFTTILDPADASAVDLAVAYAQRWETDTAFEELRTDQRGTKVVLRSKLVDLVYQEIWGYLCCLYAVRTLMFEAADHARVNTDRVSFVAALRLARRSISQARDFPLTTFGTTSCACSLTGSTRYGHESQTAADRRQDAPVARQAKTSPQLATARKPAPNNRPPDHSIGRYRSLALALRIAEVLDTPQEQLFLAHPLRRAIDHRRGGA